MTVYDPLELTPAHTVLGEYQLFKKLGQGGMAEVFLAYRRGPAGCGKLSVVKKLRPHLAHRTGWRQMLLDEAKVAARLNHPNIIQTYDVGDTDGVIFITMEYLEGLSLGQIMRHFRRQGRRLPVDIVCFIMAEVLDGLSYAHNLTDFDGTPLHIVHRDVSPQNLFVTYDGQTKLLDFGVAKATILTQDTSRRVIKGKLAYLAPEQARRKAVDHRADLWSAGVVLWEALTGHRLFRGASKVETLTNSLSSAVPAVKSHNPLIPEDLDQLCQQALSRDLDQRLGTAGEFSRKLRQFARVNGGPVRRQDVAAFVEYHFADQMKRRSEELRQLLSAADACPPTPAEPPAELPDVPPQWSTELATDTQVESSHSSSEDTPLSVSLRWPFDGLDEPVRLLGTIGAKPPPLSWQGPAGMLIISMLCALATAMLILYFQWLPTEYPAPPGPPPAVSTRAAKGEPPSNSLSSPGKEDRLPGSEPPPAVPRPEPRSLQPRPAPGGSGDKPAGPAHRKKPRPRQG